MIVRPGLSNRGETGPDDPPVRRTDFFETVLSDEGE
jgi:hypothetical protein